MNNLRTKNIPKKLINVRAKLSKDPKNTRKYNQSSMI